MKPFIALLALLTFAASMSTNAAAATGRNAKNLDISNEEDPAEFLLDLKEMGVDDYMPGYTPAEGGSRLSVVIDKPSQTITISEDNRVILQDQVSTGGTLKSPNNPRNPKPPRCANTPNFKKYIPANNNTMYPVWKSQTYVNSETFEPVPMPFAIHIEGGFFLHEVPPGMVNYLGYAVSGGCIRLPSKTARFLYAKMKEHGGINFEVVGANPSPSNNPPPYNHICQRDANGVAHKIAVKGGAPVGNGLAQSASGRPMNIQPTYQPPSRSSGFNSIFSTIMNPLGTR